MRACWGHVTGAHSRIENGGIPPRQDENLTGLRTDRFYGDPVLATATGTLRPSPDTFLGGPSLHFCRAHDLFTGGRIQVKTWFSGWDIALFGHLELPTWQEGAISQFSPPIRQDVNSTASANRNDSKFSLVSY